MCKIVHLTSAHPRNDTRIFIKQCRTLAAHGYDVTLVVADDQGDERREGVTITDVGRLPGRARRILVTPRRIRDKALSLDADIYQLHDPELLPVGLALKRRGKTVIFDSHEDVPRQLLGKPYLGPVTRRALALAFALAERYACARFDGVIAATPFIRDKFLKFKPGTVDVNNFPLVGELENAAPWSHKRQEVCYVGGIGEVRGIRELAAAGRQLHSAARINLVGKFSEPAVEAEVRADPGWQRVNELGVLDRAGVRAVMERSLAGIVTFHPLPNHLDSLPTKMFEYMSAGIPVIASDFPLWRGIVEGNRCGICVDPLDPGALAAAIDHLAAHPAQAREMGENGRRAVLKEYNWTVQARKLTDFYGALSHVRQAVAHV
ncbi:glycosyltransferase family 4 protein [Massilia sp. G4R7]|uniref:Glycosyltransferase family 4 protein n=1 Tax=Massilia phyllostachyos TaxID=2898585 RepID=A0ABS8Q3I0_9BURK|nr:glycosyltransferase family 4 protein [Massilia phyllostachyos]MCD2516306.1 glycosyltransferase family 4 protein [Massilia phyllostachyos]